MKLQLHSNLIQPRQGRATNRRSLQDGFSLIEVMIVVAIVGIFAALAAPSFAQILASQRNAAAATDLIADFDRARSEAIRINTTVSVCLVPDANAANPVCMAPLAASTGTDWSNPVVLFAKAGGNNNRSQIETGDVVLWRGQAPNSSVRVLFSDSTEAAISFDSNGFRIGSSLAGTFTIDAAKNVQISSLARCVLINSVGQYKVGRYSRIECAPMV